MRAAGLLQKSRMRGTELSHAAWLFELLPIAPKRLWQAGVTYIRIRSHGWWYAITVIDYYPRCLLKCHFTPSHRAGDVDAALDAARSEAERLHGPLAKCPFLVSDTG